MNVNKLIRMAGVTCANTALDWKRVESRIESQLPEDFKLIVDTCGLGTWRNWVILYGPGYDSYDIDVVPFEIIDSETDFLQTLTVQERAEDFPYPLWPEAEGLFPFGTTVQADRLYWRMSGRPDQWTIVVNATRDTQTEEFNCSTSDFLCQFVSGSLRCQFFPDFSILEPEPVFLSFNKQG